MANLSAALVALADPTRQAVFERVAQGPISVSDISDGMPVSRPAVSQHLKILKDAGLVRDRAEGTRRIYSIDPEGLAPLREWLDRFWGKGLESFAAEVEKQNREEVGSP